MIREYIYNEKTYRSAYRVRQAVFEATGMAFGEEPAENKEEFWAQLNVTYTETPDPEPTPEEIAERELADAKRERARQVEAITVEVDGMTFDGDETSQQRVARSIIALDDGESMPWVLYDNTVVSVTKEQLKKVLRLAGLKQSELWTVPYQKKQ